MFFVQKHAGAHGSQSTNALKPMRSIGVAYHKRVSVHLLQLREPMHHNGLVALTKKDPLKPSTVLLR